LALLAVSFIRRDETLKYVGLELLFAIAVLTMPAFMTGVGAFSKIQKEAGVSLPAIRLHQDVAIYAFIWMELAGFVAWFALWQARRRGRAAKTLVVVATGLSVVAFVVMAVTANIGGAIRHPEINGDVTAAAALDPMQFFAAKISYVMVNSPWAWPASESVHFLGLSLTFGALLAVNLRILGAMKHVPFTDVHRLLPWGMLGFAANLITGMLFFVGQPQQYLDSAPFYWKVVFLMVAGANFIYLTVFRKAWTPAAAERWEPGVRDKAMAFVSIFAWLAILYAGRMLPFIGHAF